VTVYFFDSSALTKRYIQETGTTWIRQVSARSSRNRIWIAEITPVEVVSAVSRLKREGKVSARSARAIRLLLNRHAMREYDVILFSQSILRAAQDLLDVLPLRAYDAIQLASALDSNARLTEANLAPLIFVSADTRLLNTAAAAGLQIHHPA
jgi:predicted nucleic acid-binding protein